MICWAPAWCECPECGPLVEVDQACRICGVGGDPRCELCGSDE